MRDSLLFDASDYEIKTRTIENITITYRAFEKIEYCAKPADEIQKLNLFVPEDYYRDKKISGYSRKTAPIFIPNSVGGYLPGPCEQPGKDHNGQGNALFYALAHGYVVASIGVRGRTTGKQTDAFFEGSTGGKLGENTGKMVGKAPALIVDMKAGIRYLKKNRKSIPGDTDRIITSGTSAGGALSALTGATGNHPDYEPYLQAIGSVVEKDYIFAANCYCPIHNLENSDAAYEWLFCGCNTYHGMKIKNTGEGMKFTPITGEMNKKQIILSHELKTMFPEYVNSLGLTDETGNLLTLEPDGTGSFKEWVCSYMIKSAQQELDTYKTRDHLTTHATLGNEVELHPAFTIQDGVIVSVDLEVFVKDITRMKQTPAFDALNLDSPENEEFGTESIMAQHFTDFGVTHSEAAGTKADNSPIRMLNPVPYIRDEQAVTAKYWRIRHGSHDRDTSLAIPVILATMLKNQGEEVDISIPWGINHRGDYDLEELFAWIDTICNSSKCKEGN